MLLIKRKKKKSVLSSPGLGRMVHVRDGVSATHSVCEELDLQIAKLCHSPVWFSCHQGLFRFPEAGGRVGALHLT